MSNRTQTMHSRFLSSVLVLVSSAAAFAQNTPGYNNKIPESILTTDAMTDPLISPVYGNFKWFPPDLPCQWHAGHVPEQYGANPPQTAHGRRRS